MVLGRNAAEKMNTIAALYPAKADVKQAIVPDFHSTRQAFNVASADQRILLIAHGTEDDLESLRESLKPVASHSEVVGRVHFDFQLDLTSNTKIKGLQQKSGIAIVRADEFGLRATVMQELPTSASADSVVEALKVANVEFAKTTEKKVYSTHVAKGRKEGIYFEGNVPYGEDRDGDGEIDHRGGGGSRGGSRSGGGSRSSGRGSR